MDQKLLITTRMCYTVVNRKFKHQIYIYMLSIHAVFDKYYFDVYGALTYTFVSCLLLMNVIMQVMHTTHVWVFVAGQEKILYIYKIGDLC